MHFNPFLRPLGAAMVLILGLATFGAAHAAPGPTALVGDASVPYSADRTVTAGNKTYTGRVYAVPGRQRHEQMLNGLHPVAIIRADLRLVWLMLPEMKIYAQFAIPGTAVDLGQVAQLGPPLGHERIAGFGATKYRMHRQSSDGSSFDGILWMTPEGIVVKLDATYITPNGRPDHVTMELANIRIGPQDPALFDLPKGVSKLPPEALQPLLNMK